MKLRNGHHRHPVKPHIWAVFSLLSVAVGSMLLSGCQTPPPPEPEPVAPAQPITIAPERLRQLLELGNNALAAGRLTDPQGDNAEHFFRQILAVQADQPDALQGLDRIIEQFVARALDALDQRQPATARSMLARARLINPDHPSIAPTSEQVRLLSEAKITKLSLDPKSLANPSAELVSQLKNLVSDAQGNCRFLIAASNDAQGRWLYQTLQSAATGSRLRAQLEIKRPSSVERLCYPD